MTDDQSQRAPYPGLRAFRREETDLFFGREDCINAMVDRLAATRFLAVLGSSGTGKSSLVKTGLLDALELGLMAKAGSRWKIVDFRPGGAPLKNLARRLLEVEHPDSGAAIAQQDVDLLRAFLARGPRAVVEWCTGNLPNGANLLLLVDQFEELFRYQDYAGREEAEAFVAMLLESAREADLPIYVAITMRSEYLGACALIEGLADAINAGMFLTPRMTREHCRDAIVGPAAVCNIAIEPALVNRLLNDLANFAPWEDKGANDQLDRLMRRADQLPLLQYTLNRMWQRARERSSDLHVQLTLADYEAIEGLSGALNAHANQIFEDLGKARAQVAEWVFRALTAGSTIADAVRRPTRLDDLIATCGGDEASVRAVVDAFRAPGVNFLVPEYDPHRPHLAPDTYIDISHESLIRQWKKLSGWLEAEGRAAQQWRRLVDRYNNDERLGGRDLASFIAWRKETKPNAIWAKRYGGDYPAVIAYLDRRQRAQTGKLVATVGSIGLAFALITSIAIFAIQQRNLVELNQARFTKAFTDLFFSLQVPLGSTSSPVQSSPASRAGTARSEAANREERQESSQPETTQIPEETVDRTTASVGTRQSLALSTITILEETARKLYEANPTSIDFQRLFVVGLIQLGDAKLQNKDLDGAEKAFSEGLKTVIAMLRTNPKELLWLDDHALSLAGLGRVSFQRGDFAKAREYFEGAIGIERQFATGADDRLLKNLQIHWGELGDTLVRMRELGEARKAFEARLSVRRERLKLDPRDPQRWVDVSVALDRVGQLLRDEGDLDGSRKYFEQALKIDQNLIRINPKRRDWQENLVFSLTRIGDLEYRLGRYREALPSYDEAHTRQKAIISSTNAIGPLQTMATILGRIGDINRRLRNFPASIAAHREELDLRRRLLARDQSNLSAMRSVSSALDYLGNALRENRDLSGARAAFTEQLQIDRGIVDADPDNATSLLDLAWSLNRLGDLDRDADKLKEAIGYYEEALAIQRKLFARSSDNPARMRALALILAKLGLARLRLNDYKAALALHTEELELRTQLYDRAKDDANAMRDFSLANDRVGNVLRNMKNYAAARKYFIEALAIDRRLVVSNPDVVSNQTDLAWSLNRLGDLDRDTGNPGEAARHYTEALEIQRNLIERDPENPVRMRALALALSKLGLIRSRLGDHKTALTLHLQELDLRSGLFQRARDDTDALRDLSQANDRVGNVLRDMKDYAGALKYYLEELALDRGFVAHFPDNITALQDVQWTLNKVYDFVRQHLNDLPRARSYIEEMIGIDRRLLARQPNNRERHKRLSDDLAKLGSLLVDLKEPEAARRAYDETFQAAQKWLVFMRELYAKASTAANRSELASAYGNTGWHGILAGRAKDAQPLIEAALGLNPDLFWSTVNLGHAYLFLGEFDQAMQHYRSVKDRNRTEDGKRKYLHEIRDDFVLFRRLGLTPPGMDRVERELGLDQS